jgi:hypothetical protein
MENRHAYFAGFNYPRAMFSNGHFDRFVSRRCRLDGGLQWEHDAHSNEQRDGHDKCQHERPAELRRVIGEVRTRIRHRAIGTGAYQRDSGRE